jgi:hypothetical protein
MINRGKLSLYCLSFLGLPLSVVLSSIFVVSVFPRFTIECCVILYLCNVCLSSVSHWVLCYPLSLYCLSFLGLPLSVVLSSIFVVSVFPRFPIECCVILYLCIVCLSLVKHWVLCYPLSLYCLSFLGLPLIVVLCSSDTTKIEDNTTLNGKARKDRQYKDRG